MSSILLLIPTSNEMLLLKKYWAATDSVSIEVCGFGPIASTAHTARLLFQAKPSKVILVGIAGAVGSRLRIGQASEFDSVASFGVGAGSGSEHQTAAELGWPQHGATAGTSMGDLISINESARSPRLLVSVCSASASAHDVDHYRKRYPDVIAEDMEGYSVALVCQMHGVPLTIVRGISNVAGDRDKSRWQIESAMEASASLVQEILNRCLPGTIAT